VSRAAVSPSWPVDDKHILIGLAETPDNVDEAYEQNDYVVGLVAVGAKDGAGPDALLDAVST
jgi:hypothetical protein